MHFVGSDSCCSIPSDKQDAVRWLVTLKMPPANGVQTQPVALLLSRAVLCTCASQKRIWTVGRSPLYPSECMQNWRGPRKPCRRAEDLRALTMCHADRTATRAPFLFQVSGIAVGLQHVAANDPSSCSNCGNISLGVFASSDSKAMPSRRAIPIQDVLVGVPLCLHKQQRKRRVQQTGPAERCWLLSAEIRRSLGRPFNVLQGFRTLDSSSQVGFSAA